MLIVAASMVSVSYAGAGCPFSGCGKSKKAPVAKAEVKKAAKGEKTIKLCAACGEAKGSEKCCKADAEKCSKVDAEKCSKADAEKCGLNKKSPGSCKLSKATVKSVAGSSTEKAKAEAKTKSCCGTCK